MVQGVIDENLLGKMLPPLAERLHLGTPAGRLEGRCCSNGAAWCFSFSPRKISKNIFEANEKNGRAR